MNDDDRIRLIGIEPDGSLELKDVPPLTPIARQVCDSMVPLYRKNGFEPPWTGFLALRGGRWIGTCAFKSPPVENRVEIAYFTFPDFEGQGVATHMAALLVNIASAMDPALEVTARTLPEENASTAVLRKLGFNRLAAVHDPEDGPVWEWGLRSNRER